MTQTTRLYASTTRNFLALLTSRFVGQMVSLGVGLLLVRWLADEAFAAYSLATTTLGLAGIIVDGGFDPILTREVARSPERAQQLFSQSVLVRLTLGITVLIFLLILGDDAIGRRDLLLIGGIALLPRGAVRAAAAILTGRDRARSAALLEAVASLAISLLTIIFLLILPRHLTDGASAAILALLLGNLIGAVAAILFMRTALAVNTLPSPASTEIVALFRAGLPFLLVGLAGAVFQSLDLYIVQRFHTVPAASIDPLALYAAPFRLLNVLLLVPTAWGVVALPRYVRQLDDPTILRTDLVFNTVIGVALSLGCMISAPVLTPLVLGAGYTDAAPILAVIGWMTLPVCLSAPMVAWITAHGRQQRIFVSVLLAGSFALLLHIIWAVIAPADVQTRLIGVAAIKVLAMICLLGCYGLSMPRTFPLAKRTPQSKLN